MSSYCNVYQTSPGIVSFGIYNLLGHIDGHITVWLKVDGLAWCWAKTGDYANLTSILEVKEPVMRVPDEVDRELVWSHIVRQMQGTCFPDGRFILPEDQARADAEQKEFDGSPEDSWMRRAHAEQSSTNVYLYGIPWGADRVMTGTAVSEHRYRLDEKDEELNRQAEAVLNP